MRALQELGPPVSNERDSIAREMKGPMCYCVPVVQYYVTVYTDGRVRYEFHIGGRMVEWRTVDTWAEYLLAYEAFLDAKHARKYH